ncbi:hypothetical protein ACHWQZ_G016836 [Mnemiopsis leidyi]
MATNGHAETNGGIDNGDGPYVSPEDIIKPRTCLPGLTQDMWQETHYSAIYRFFCDENCRILVSYIDKNMGLVCDNNVPTSQPEQVSYFIKLEPVKLSKSNFHSSVTYGTCNSDYMHALLGTMHSIYAPVFFKNTTWPESVRNDFAAQLHKFMACLTDTAYKMEGKTVLYIPEEDVSSSLEKSAKNKELVARLETSVIHWTRQIKEVLSAQDALEMSENSGPLEEIAFWKSRCTDLSGISKQLDQEGIQNIKEILTLSKSSYIAPFSKLAKQIQDNTAQAQSNLKFLSALKEPCEELARSEPAVIPPMLSKILNVIRIIWTNSDHYRSRERLTALLRKFSNEIIMRCCTKISLDDIFSGEVEKSIEGLDQSIQCCEAWKENYNDAAATHNRFSEVKWLLDRSSIFAQIDAFVQRCKDLKEVCEGQSQFGRYSQGKKRPLPIFAGLRGPEIARSLREIEDAFEKNLNILRKVKVTILDVKSTAWHDAYNKFRMGVKDLEVMMQNVISSAFETVTTVDSGVQVLDVFQHLSSREAIKRTIDKKTVDVYQKFNEELNLVKKEFNTKTPNLTPTQPKFAGAAAWARALKRRIDRPMDVINKAFYLPRIGAGEEIRNQYQQLSQALEEFVGKTFQEWALSIDKDLGHLLDAPLMSRCHDKSTMLDVNFDRTLLKLFREIYYWERLKFEIPHYAAEVYAKEEDLRTLRENVLLVVRDYNRILAALNTEERGLFKERIKFLDKKIHPGLTKLTWASKGPTTDYFMNECRGHASKVQAIVDSYKHANRSIQALCKRISESLLVSIDSKRIYESNEFEVEQQKHRATMQNKLVQLHEEIIAIMKNTYEVFKNDGTDVQLHWHRYTEKTDKMVEEAFRLNIKRSLQELSRAIHGDGKTAPNPLFKVKVVLHEKDRVDFSPTTKKLADMMNVCAKDLTTCISIIPRLPEILSKKRGHKETMPIFTVIGADEETKKLKTQIQQCMVTNAGHLVSYLHTWDNCRELWDINKDAFIRRYERAKPLMSKFDADISRYSEVANNIQKEETVQTIQFVLLDCQPLKFALLQHCNEWQNKFTTLLSEMATNKLDELTVFLQSNCKNLSKPPETLEELGNSLALLEQLKTNQEEIEGRFPPLYEQFNILRKHEVQVDDKVQEKLDELGNEWQTFANCLHDSDVMLKKHKDKFKAGLLHSAEEYKKSVALLLDEFNNKGPFSSDKETSQAVETIHTIRASSDTLKEQEATIRKGLNIFKIDQAPNKDIVALDLALEHLEAIWEINSEWTELYNGWKLGKFKDLVTDDMELVAQKIYKRIVKISREIKDKKWEVAENVKGRVEQFKRTMPLIQDLKNPALRPRHWVQLKAEVGKEFDHEGEDFTLEKIIDLGLDQYGTSIGDISGAASKELSIEQAIKAISSTWEAMELDISPYKDRGHHRLKATDELFQMLEDNQVSLATMKASRYVKAFEVEVDQWERTLSRILEVIELILTVQRQWMYLENIFLGEDIRKQLPRESAEFDDVNHNWKTIMDSLSKDNNALRGTHQANMLERLNDMNNKLEDIQKSLDMYLETKRQIFPRFYFLSNDDLLEILGQSRNPTAVQPHLKKCFDNIVQLQMEKIGIDSKGGKMEAVAMFSADGEKVEFNTQVTLEGPVEAWLCDIEDTMRVTLRQQLKLCRVALKKAGTKRDKWTKEWPGQLLITTSQMQWTQDCTKALSMIKDRGDKKSLKSMKKKQISMLTKFSDAIRGNLTPIQRAKIVALVTIEVHARDVIDKLIKSNCNDVMGFEWLMQLRFYWEKEIDDCTVQQTNTQFRYGYEYLGNSGRLVITPLTDRCYMTLTTALHLHRGGSPKGPAGTGKTETVKDLGKALGDYVIVVNCSEGLDFKSMGRMFSGLAQTGAWGCFDEFNRINIEVLSVVAQQILSILSALAAGYARFVFECREINLVWSCGIFITMNPGYAGRTELPDNLKSMFRPISMVVPDSCLISEIILFGEGFNNTKVLAKKVFTLYSLAVQQLSQQEHYDFGLRALVSVLKYAGRKKRALPEYPDEEILLLAMKDMNVAKLTSDDTPLFNGIVQDLFPGVETPVLNYGDLQTAIESQITADGLQKVPVIITKIIQLYETKNSRHSVMIVGDTGSGKSVVWKVLKYALSNMWKADANNPKNGVKEYPINPKALSLGELYGEFDLNTNEWTDGVLSAVMRKTCSEDTPDEKWILFDGPVDTLWIESMNSVMDDNKVLTLINGERISMPQQVSLLFEVGDLSVASPATVSRCGMVYMDSGDLGWQPFVDSWLEKQKDTNTKSNLRRMFDKYIVPVLDFRKKMCKEIVTTSTLNSVKNLCVLYDCLATVENGVNPKDEENHQKMVELWFLFSMIWSVCCTVTGESRKIMDNFIRELEGQFPSKDTVYEYYIDVKQKFWVLWEDKLRSGWRYNPAAPFYKIVVPTVDTVRYEFITQALITGGAPVMLVGPVGTGKTSVAQAVLAKASTKQYGKLVVNMSAQTTSNNVQDIIESRVEKRTKGVYVPIGGKRLLAVMDDFNMPAKDEFFSQPPLELLRQWIDYSFWYDRQKQIAKEVRDMQLIAAMGPPGGGRQSISPRLLSRFHLINMAFPNEAQIQRIFGTMINQKLQDFEEDVKPVGNMITQATIELYNTIVSTMLPTPTKIHYLFNLRDISKIYQGLLRAHKDYHDTRQSMIRLWIHECFRVFSDRFSDQTDMEYFRGILGDKLGAIFDTSFNAICPNKISPIFGDFLRGAPGGIYEDITDINQLKQYMETTLEDYNMEPGVISMDLVLFRDAMEHICRIVRVIGQPRGNMLLVGVGGSGRQSLAKVASYISQFKVFQIEVSRHYRTQEFREDLRSLYWMAGVENKPTVFLFNDTQVVTEDFLEDINNVLSSGEVPNLYAPDEFDEVKEALLDEAKKDGISDSTDTMFAYFIERVRSNLHVVLCMSPVGDPFRNRIRQYPAFVNCTTIDWFTEWPKDALLEVAERYLEKIDLDPSMTEPAKKEALMKSCASMFVTSHQSVVENSNKMLLEMKRHNYVTPTNYLELVTGYISMLSDKRKELDDAAKKLRNGLFKIDDTRAKVEVMSVELEESKTKVLQFQKECEEYLVVIVQQKREADEQQKAVVARSAKIGEEEVKCRQIADAAEADLEEALPFLEAAVLALNSLNKKDITEIRSYNKAPGLVQDVMEAVMVLRGSDPSWPEAKKQLGDPNFIQQLINYDKDNMSDRILKKIGTYVNKPEFVPDSVGRVSNAAKSLCMWVRAMEVYGRVYRVIEPKRRKLAEASAQLKEKQDSLQEARDKLQEVTERMENLKKQYDEKLRMKEELRKSSELTQLRLERAGKLLSGLAGEKIRWEESAGILETNIGYLVGDCLVASAFCSYMGPFLSDYRENLVNKVWLPEVRKLSIPCNPEFTVSSFLAKPTDVRDWNIKGLPSDNFSTENGIIVTRGLRWPLMIDPQCQAIKWIKNMEKGKLKTIDLQQYDFLRTLENSIQFGTPVLLQNVQESLDPSLAPILDKAVIKQGGRLLIKLGDKEVDYNPDFKFYITTRLSNPHYTPEIATKTTIVNFAVKEVGLEAQLLGIVVRRERIDLEEQKDNLVRKIAADQRKLVELEDEILRLLNAAEGSLLDDEVLVETLQTSKVTSQEISEQLEVSEETEYKIDLAREGYRPCAQRASILFFVLNDMGRIDPMYQFSLDAYNQLFNQSIDKSTHHSKLEDRILALNDYHTYAVYKFTCRALFEHHKLLFSFQTCAKIMEAAGKLDMEEYTFFLKGGVVMDRETQMDNPCKWLDDASWDNITELDKLTNFHGIANSFEQYARDWHLWYTSSAPEDAMLPGEWGNSCNELQKMLIVRSLRKDRVAFCATSFIINNLGAKFVEPPVLDMTAVVEDSSCKTPLIFVLSAGVDPTSGLVQLADEVGMKNRFSALSLGQGQAPLATKLIKEGVKEGNWVYLANCHLSLSWMPHLDKLVEQLQSEEPHPDFRLWLSSNPTKGFPISILQAGLKMTTEPPKGLRANMKRLYGLVSERTFSRCKKPEKYKKLLFTLCFFHSVLIERRKFLQLGWNIPYDFNDSDFEVSENLLNMYLDEYEETPWDALKYLIAGVNYGGHVTDDLDRRLLHTYINDFFNENVLNVPFYKLSSLNDTYYVPKDGPYQHYKDYISLLPNVDHPAAFGQHPNADITSQIRETHMLFETLLSLQPQVSSVKGESTEDKVLGLSQDVKEHLPELIDYENTLSILAEERNTPMGVVLLQEILRYNHLVTQISNSLVDLEKGIKGLVVMSEDLEEIFRCINEARVPKMWSKAYPSLKPLGSWTRDLVMRVDQFFKWAHTGTKPLIFYLSYFTFPTGFLTAVLQTSARANSISVDTLSWEFVVQILDDVNITGQPKDGVYIKGMYLEGAGWDKKNCCLVEANAMQLVCEMPTIHFKPAELKKKPGRGIYSCPCYYYPDRAGTADRASFVVSVDLKSGAATPDHWIKRGTALLLSLDA